MADNSLPSSSSGPADDRKRTATPEEENIRKWVASLFTQSVRIGERLLEDGHLAMAAVMFADATLLTDQAETFVRAVQRVYPSYFYRLYELRLLSMGYDHLFPKNTTKATGHGSPADGHRLLFDANHSSGNGSSNSQHAAATTVSLMPPQR